MKAICCRKYGPPEDLRMEEVDKPTIKNNQVLVRVMATAVNDYDWSMTLGQPYLYRLMFGFGKPKNPILGMELSGVIEEVGSDVIAFNVGDRVYGDTSDHEFGTFAEYIALNHEALKRMPDEMSFEDAAALPHASLLAIQALKDMAGLDSSKKVLINGAGGGVGSIALQYAKLFNCEVDGVDTGPKLEAMKALGFDEVIDYKKENFTKRGKTYDIIVDAKTCFPMRQLKKALNADGQYITVGGQLGKMISMLLFGRFAGKGKSFKILALKPNKGLEYISELYLQNKIRPVIDGPHELAKAPELIRYFGEGEHHGKVVMSTLSMS